MHRRRLCGQLKAAWSMFEGAWPRRSSVEGIISASTLATIFTLTFSVHTKSGGFENDGPDADLHACGRLGGVARASEPACRRRRRAGGDARIGAANGTSRRREAGAQATERDCFFHDNENGILTGANAESDIVVEHSEFANNGFGDGQSHNLYIGRVRSFTLRFSYVHHALVGHNVKSRARRNTVTYNRIMDENDGRSSYALEFPNGGLAFVIGNLIQKGPETENSTAVSYGAEGLQHPLNELYFVNNTVANDRPGGGLFLFVKTGTDAARIVNNVFTGRGEVLSGPGEARNNVVAPKTAFVAAADFDYRLRAGAGAIGRAIDPGSAQGFDLRPTAEYAHKAKKRARDSSGKLDAGALEYRRAR